MSHPLSSTVSSESAKTSDHILWLRTPGDGAIHYITSIGEIEIHDQYNGSLMFKKSIRNSSQILREDLLPWGESEWFRQVSLGLLPTNFWGYPEGWDGHGRPADGPSIIINGDYSPSGESLYLNICKIEKMDDTPGYSLTYSRAKLLYCEFIDFDSNFNVTRYSVSWTEYAVTFPTETGTFRVYSNHAIEDPERRQFGSIPWISTGGDPNGGATILPYPLSNGTTWTTTSLCSSYWGSRGNNHYVLQDIYELNRTNHSQLRFERVAGISFDCRIETGYAAGHYLARMNQQIYAGDGCWMGTPDMTDIMRITFTESEEEDYDFNNFSSIPISWFHIRLPQNSFVRGVDIPENYWRYFPDPIYTSPEGYGVEHRLCAFSYDMNAYNSDNVYGELGQGSGFYNTFDIDHDNGVVYNVDCDWSIQNRGTKLGHGCREIYTHPDEVWYLNWPSKFSSSPTIPSNGIDGSFAPILLIFLIFGLVVTTSRKSNDSLAKFVGKAAKSAKIGSDLEERVRGLHHDNWNKPTRPVGSDVASIVGGGIMAFFGGIAILGFYSLYAVLMIAAYMTIAYLVIAGIALLALGYMAGLICFLPLLLLGALFG
uniref:Uncharacterized protein n=1 Tax=uncultured marine group II/III euryarchaeote SAT1000_07_H02 TaxID=1456555 RepID=A0A075I866_9EURY|nr:hypothetical protein [uncultured marine group II/III euryarchaeote SAT1000_07_H02]